MYKEKEKGKNLEAKAKRKHYKIISIKRSIQTDGVHQKDRTGPGVNSDEAWSEAVKIIKGFGAILLQRIQTNSMSQTH